MAKGWYVCNHINDPLTVRAAMVLVAFVAAAVAQATIVVVSLVELAMARRTRRVVRTSARSVQPRRMIKVGIPVAHRVTLASASTMAVFIEPSLGLSARICFASHHVSRAP